MATIDTVLAELLKIDGATGAAIVDADSGMTLGTAGNPPFSLEYAAAGNSEVVKAKLRTMSSLGINENIEDILITLTGQYHLIRVLGDTGAATLFIYLALDRGRANLALARHKVATITADLEI